MAHGFVHARTAAGVTLDGRPIVPVIGARRRRPQLVDYLDTARDAGVDRLWLTGPRPGVVRRGGDLSEWLTLPAPGWSSSTTAGHFFDADRPAGRFVHEASGDRVTVRRAWQWFGDVDDPADAAAAWRLVEREMVAPGVFGPGAHLWDSPAATGQAMLSRTWSHLAERARRRNAAAVAELPPPMLDRNVAGLIRSTSTQHRVAPYSPPTDLGDKLPGFVYLDARFAFAKHTRELGCAPVTQLHGNDAAAFADANPYARARYKVTFRAPDGWSHVGVFLAPVGNGDWDTPTTGSTWCDAAELFVARRWGWQVLVTDALVLTKGRPLDAWTDSLLRLRTALEGADAPPVVRTAASAAARAILLQTIGSFNATGVDLRHYVATPMDAPRGVRLTPYGAGFTYTTRAELRGAAAAMARPEWSAQVWGRARAAILDGAQGEHNGERVRAGALHVPADHVIGVHGDALYLTTDPRWPNGDDVGQLRVKGAITRPVDAPRTGQQVYDLARASERALARRKATTP